MEWHSREVINGYNIVTVRYANDITILAMNEELQHMLYML